jgi:hypothetical protein
LVELGSLHQEKGKEIVVLTEVKKTFSRTHHFARSFLTGCATFIARFFGLFGTFGDFRMFLVA